MFDAKHFGLWGDSLDHLDHLLLAFVLALPIGWHRGREEQSAGSRTFPLVAMASCGLVQTAISVIGASLPFNASILAGVVTGIGFIGAGAIIRQGDFTTGSRYGGQPLDSRHHGRGSATVTTTSGSF
jgi:putative Mg2+ transporter-C (MgtC) family protein